MLAASFAACGGSAASPTAAAGPTVSNAWVRPPMGPDRPAAGYLTIAGDPDTDDALLGATSPVASMVELHETTAGASGMAAMHQVERVAIPAGSTIALEPGGYHLMLMNPSGPLEVGGTVELTLTFETAGAVTVTAEVRQN
ncbi:MAG TPA: copper chaperone PCu(A)C [Clostridia bacterium]|nr:copper chaperone PCu(A)C [Clostridia bacterium]